MNDATRASVSATRYDRSACQIGVVHLGFGAFHRAHQAVYIDDYLQASGDLRWGIAAVNLRGAETGHFDITRADIARHDGYYLKSYSAEGEVALRRVRSHVHFADWSVAQTEAEALLSKASVHLVTITVTESGYYTDPNGDLNTKDATIAAEAAGGNPQSVYAYLRAALGPTARIAADLRAIAPAKCICRIRIAGWVDQHEGVAIAVRAVRPWWRVVVGKVLHGCQIGIEQSHLLSIVTKAPTENPRNRESDAIAEFKGGQVIDQKDPLARSDNTERIVFGKGKLNSERKLHIGEVNMACPDVGELDIFELAALKETRVDFSGAW